METQNSGGLEEGSCTATTKFVEWPIARQREREREREREVDTGTVRVLAVSTHVEALTCGGQNAGSQPSLVHWCVIACGIRSEVL